MNAKKILVTLATAACATFALTAGISPAMAAENDRPDPSIYCSDTKEATKIEGDWALFSTELQTPNPSTTPDGYTFSTWHLTDPDTPSDFYCAAGQYLNTWENILGGDATYNMSPVYTANPANVTYDANGGTGTTAATQSETDAKVDVANNSFSRDGYTFTAWNTAKDGSGTAYAPGASLTLPAGGITLYAQWTAVKETTTPPVTSPTTSTPSTKETTTTTTTPTATKTATTAKLANTGSDIGAILLAAVASLGLGTLLVIRRQRA